jgi:hypothetical protein
MADIAAQTLRVLRCAVELGEFTKTELADQADVSYETVKRVLRNEAGATIARTEQTSTGGVGRPATIWAVIDSDAIAERLRLAAQEVEPSAEDRAPTRTLDDDLALAEDYVVLALEADIESDARDYARRALAALGDARPAGEQTPGRNLPVREARSLIVVALAEYVLGDETAGVAGESWRRAFSAIEAVDLPEEAAMHKRFLIDLVYLATQRAPFGMLPIAELVELLAAEIATKQPPLIVGLADSAAGREAITLALARLVSDVVDGSRDLDADAMLNLCDVIPQAVVRGDAPDELVEALCALALRGPDEVTDAVVNALVDIGEPRRHAAWARVAGLNGSLRLHRALFAGLSRTNPGAAYSYVRDVLEAGVPLEAVLDVLVDELPSIAAVHGRSAEEQFGAFLAGLPDEQRSFLLAAPRNAGLRWSAAELDRALIARFFSALTHWRSFVRSDHDDDRLALGQTVVELVGQIDSLLDGEQRRRAVRALAEESPTAKGASVGVPALLELGCEEEIAGSVVSRRPRDSQIWASVADWYLDVCPRDKLELPQKVALLNAFRPLLGFHHRGLVTRLRERSPATLPELFELKNIDPGLLYRMELDVSGGYRGDASRLQELAEPASFIIENSYYDG